MTLLEMYQLTDFQFLVISFTSLSSISLLLIFLVGPSISDSRLKILGHLLTPGRVCLEYVCNKMACILFIVCYYKTDTRLALDRPSLLMAWGPWFLPLLSLFSASAFTFFQNLSLLRLLVVKAPDNSLLLLIVLIMFLTRL